MLAYPSFALLKKALPEAQIYALVPDYTREMAQICPNIDHIITDPGDLSLIQLLREIKFDAAITLFSTSRIGWMVRLANIPYRLAPATKIAQIFYNHRLRQRRSRSEKPEYQYNLDLIRHFLRDHDIPVPDQPKPPYLQFDAQQISQLKQKFCSTHGVDSQARLIFLHCGSGGSANNLSMDQYAELVEKLPSSELHIVITAGPGELNLAEQLASKLSDVPHTIYHSSNGLLEFARHIQFADLFISGSTGPLHIAGALNRPTVAFYPKRQSATPLRWQTTNEEKRRLAFTPPGHSDDTDMSSIDIEQVAMQIQASFL